MAGGMKIKWSKDPKVWAHVFGDNILDSLDKILDDVVDLAVNEMVKILESKVTNTGLARAASGGGHPGRIDTGDMRDDIKGRVHRMGKHTIVGEWGWIDDLLAYYLYQEYGAAGYNLSFEGMGALQGSFLKAREEFRKRLSKIGKSI